MRQPHPVNRRMLTSAAVAAALVGAGALVAVAQPVQAIVAECSPTLTTVGGQTVASFTTVGTCSWTVPAGASDISVLVVGGGGSGGRSDERSVGGGGGGGVAEGDDLPLTGPFLVTVGAGGTNTQGCGPWPETSSGGESSISNVDFVGKLTGQTIIADGGGRGAGCGENDTAASGGSGGGGHADWVVNGGPATKGFVYGLEGVTLHGKPGGAGGAADGLSGGGGGGASEVGADGSAGAGGDGGEGVSSDITGTAVVYGSGGGGIGTVSDGDGGTNAGDGLPELRISAAATVADGVANTGGGGGGAFEVTSGSGGSGIVVVRYTAGATLPPTGSSSNALAWFAAAFVALGAGLSVLRRRSA